MRLSGKSRRQKRLLKITNNPSDVRFEDLQGLLKDYGFELNRTKGSHHSFVGYVGGEKTTIVIPYKRPLKEVYVKKVLTILNEIELLDNNVDELSESDTHDDK